MIEWAIIFFAGLVTSALVVLILSPTLWRRCQALASRRVLESLPRTDMAVRAARDQFKAEYAIKLRRLERRLGALREQTFEQNLSLGRREQIIEKLQVQVSDSNQLLAEGKDLTEAAREKSVQLTEKNTKLNLELKNSRYRVLELESKYANLQALAGNVKDELKSSQDRMIELKERVKHVRLEDTILGVNKNTELGQIALRRAVDGGDVEIEHASEPASDMPQPLSSTPSPSPQPTQSAPQPLSSTPSPSPQPTQSAPQPLSSTPSPSPQPTQSAPQPLSSTPSPSPQPTQSAPQPLSSTPSPSPQPTQSAPQPLSSTPSPSPQPTQSAPQPLSSTPSPSPQPTQSAPQPLSSTPSPSPQPTQSAPQPQMPRPTSSPEYQVRDRAEKLKAAFSDLSANSKHADTVSSGPKMEQDVTRELVNEPFLSIQADETRDTEANEVPIPALDRPFDPEDLENIKKKIHALADDVLAISRSEPSE